MHKYIFQVFENQTEVLLFNKDIKNFNKGDIDVNEKYFIKGFFYKDDREGIIIENRLYGCDFSEAVLLFRSDPLFKEEEISKEYLNAYNTKYQNHAIITKNINCYYQIEKEDDFISFFVIPIETFHRFLADSETTVLIDGFNYSECMESIFEAHENQTVEELREHLNSFGWTEKIIFDDDYNLAL